jgi:hypothetical protein
MISAFITKRASLSDGWLAARTFILSNLRSPDRACFCRKYVKSAPDAEPAINAVVSARVFDNTLRGSRRPDCLLTNVADGLHMQVT